MATEYTEKKRTWPIKKLKPHPQQASMFGDLPEEELDVLIADMKKNGQRDPIHILPDGTIICGHQRVRAAKSLGWTQIDVIVRYDLESAGAEAVEEAFITDNLVRRQLSPLARARCIRRMFELDRGCQPGGLDWVSKDKLKAKIAAQMRLSPRSVNRYLLIVETPIEVQQAFDRAEISLVSAGKVARLNLWTRSEIAQRIADGEDAKSVVAEYLRKPDSRHKKVADALASFVRGLQRGKHDLDGRVDSITGGRALKYLQDLQNAQELIQELILKANKQRQRT